MFVAASRNSSDSTSGTNASPPSYVAVRASVVWIGAVRLMSHGRRLVPENFGMTPSSLWCGGLSIGPVREPGGRALAELNGTPFGASANEGSPPIAADRNEGAAEASMAA